MQNLPWKLVIEVAALIFACGFTYNSISINTQAIQKNTENISKVSERINNQESLMTRNIAEHEYIIKSIDSMGAKLDMIPGIKAQLDYLNKDK